MYFTSSLRKIIPRDFLFINIDRILYKNNTGTDIYNCIFAVIPYNKDGEQIYYTKTPGEEPCYYYTQKTLKEGAVNKFTGSVEYDGDARYEEVDHIDVALDYIRLSDGTEITLPDAAHYWYSSQTQSYLEEPEGAGSNTRPEDSVLEKTGSIRLGYTSTLLRSWMKEHYGFSHGGEYILEVSQGSIAEKAGLCAGDLIFSVDGLDAGTDYFCTEKGKAKIADGQSVVFTVERSGQESPIDLVLTK